MGDSVIKSRIQVLNNDYNATEIRSGLSRRRGTRVKIDSRIPQKQAMKLSYKIGASTRPPSLSGPPPLPSDDPPQHGHEWALGKA
ncbi:hypothetical protein D9613_006398 [Agrocybe pediades]|uniref:Uncharacterized protein n=1 Tax=Agrocybe pediades TaxID=84607 RepID=A0A8H4QUN3_9AGAR|nr:hypothetical protein D9613_006398 [Agrocybe pediades]